MLERSVPLMTRSGHSVASAAFALYMSDGS
jgi:hypothetical protein